MVGALLALAPLSLTMYLPGLPSMVQDLGATTSEGQLTLTACMFGLAGGQLIAGPLSDALGRRRPLLLGLLVYAVASLLCALAPSAGVFIGLRFIQGLAAAACMVTVLATARDLFVGADMARFLALTTLVTGLAPIFAPIVGGAVLDVASWRGIFILMAAIGGALALLGALNIRETLPVDSRARAEIPATLHAFRRLLTDRVFLGYALSSGLAGGALFAYVSASPFVLQNIYGVSPQAFSLLFGLNSVGGIITSYIGGRLVKRLQPQRILVLGLGTLLCSGLLLLVVVLAGLGLAGILIAFFLVASCFGLIVPMANALAMADYPEAAGTAAGLMGLLGFVSGGMVAPLVGIAGPGTALPMALIVVILAAGACCAYAVLVSRPRGIGGIIRRPASRPAESGTDLNLDQTAIARGAPGGMCVVTISGEYGSGSGEIAARLAKRLGWQLVDHEIVARVAHALGIAPEDAEAQDEHTDKPSPEFLASLQVMQALANAPVPVDVPRDSPAYAEARRLVVRQAAASGKVIIVGRGGQVVLAGRPDVLHARIVAPLGDRISYVMRRERLNTDAAVERIRSKDRERARFLMAEHGCDPADSHLYDIQLNTAVLDLDSAVDLLVLALERKGAKIGTPTADLGPGAGLEPYLALPETIGDPEQAK
jgi:DHA1 family bicyclomycin/chloramphenicol resistance-like MFS transporter